jgi:hypothetical protein
MNRQHAGHSVPREGGDDGRRLVHQAGGRGGSNCHGTGTRLMSVALAAAHAGHYVLPLWPKTKVPALHGERSCPGTGACSTGHRGWEQRASRDPELIRRWWQARPFNVGLATGPSRLVVLDLDAAHGQQPPPEWAGALHGRDVLTQLAERAGEPYPGDTYTVRTPTGGRHLYYSAPDDPQLVLRNTIGRLGWRIDSRAAGGYIVVAGSVVAAGRYEVIHRRPIAALPAWLIPLLVKPEPPEHEPSSMDGAAVPLSTSRRDAYLRAVRDRVVHAEDGTRHDVLLRAAASLGRLVAGGEIGDDDARVALYAAAAALERRGFPAWEIDRIIEDGLSWGQRHPRRLGSE